MSLSFSSFSTVTWHSFFNNIDRSAGPAYTLVMTFEYYFHYQCLDSKTRLPEQWSRKTATAHGLVPVIFIPLSFSSYSKKSCNRSFSKINIFKTMEITGTFSCLPRSFKSEREASIDYLYSPGTAVVPTRSGSESDLPHPQSTYIQVSTVATYYHITIILANIQIRVDKEPDLLLSSSHTETFLL